MSEEYELLFSGKANDVVPLYKYKSKKTGLTVCIAQVEGPLVNGFFCLATEAHDDDGLPHTLEHLVFMGSEEYPFKGVLDLLANRCLASGTNAWTDTDHTCYTMTTAGSEGFLNLMPIYLDHVLYPTITESAYITEVHHVNGEGEDAGVVYCEMQGRENTGESRTHLAMLRAMYPGHCGYKSETGGIMLNLRESTSHKKVCDYHKDFYRPDNLCLIITGMVKPEDVFDRLKPFEEKILSKGSLPPYTRPWQSPVPPLGGSMEEVVKYSSDDEKNGMVHVAWRGPDAREQYSVMALMVLMEYLTDTAVAPLQRDFVEIEEPYCSKVKYSIVENLQTCIYATFENVPREKLKAIKDKLLELLLNLSNEKEEIDMTRMGHVIHRRVLEAMDHLEDQPHETMAFLCIGDFLYGNTNEDLSIRLCQVASFKRMEKEPRKFWIKLVKDYFVDKNTVTIIGEPSKVLMEEMGSAETDRVKKQRETLTDAGLKAKADRLQKAIDDNEVEPTEEMMTCVDVPNVGNIHFHTIKPSSNMNSAADTNDKFPLADIPVTFLLDDIQTNFVRMTVLMDTECIPWDLKAYLPLYLELILESPVLRNGELVSHEDIISQLAADTVYNSSSLGVDGCRFTCGEMAQVATLELKLEVEKYAKGINWLRELLYCTKFTAERLKIIITKITNDVARLKRKGPTVVQAVLKSVVYKKESNHYISGMMRQHKFLTGLLEKLETKPDQVIVDLEKLRSLLVNPDNLCVHVAAHVESLSKNGPPHQPWATDFLPPNTKATGKRPEIKMSHKFLHNQEEGPGNGIIAGVGSVESAFLIQAIPCLTSHKHEDMAAILVYIQYLTQLEGPMWRQIRGLGLSYHYSIAVRPETGLMYFILFKSTHIVNAYKQAKEIVEGYLSGSTPLTEVELEMAKSSLIFERIEQEKSPAEASVQSLLSYFRGIDHNFNRVLIERIAKVTLDDLERIGTEYFGPLFDPTAAKMAICCHPTKVDEIVAGFKEYEQELKALPPLEESFLSEW